jgi:hypothetical protein
MARTVPQQHPAVVLRAHFVHLRLLLVIALIALVAMAAAVVVLATSDSSNTSSPAPITAPGPSGSTRYDGGPDEGTRGNVTPPGSNYNGPH